MSFDPTDDFFAFEQDFAGTLRCIPMKVRLKLDLCGIKLSLRQWSQLLPIIRRQLLHSPCETVNEQVAYRETLVELIAKYCDEPLRTLAGSDDHLWRDVSVVPTCILAQAERDKVSPPDLARWQRLHALQRFALVKLARSQHENENFVPALREFGLTQTGS